MAQSDFDRMMALSGFGSANQINTMRQESLASINAKRASVEEMAKMKQVLLGDKQTQRAIVTADQMGNELAQDEQIQDALRMNPFEFVIKYGAGSAKERQNIRDAYDQLRNDKASQRSTGQAIGDSSWSALNAVNQLIGSVPTLGAMAYDSIGNLTETAADAVLPDNWVNYEPMAPAVSNVFDKLGQTNRELQSETQQKKLDQFGLQQALDAADRKAAEERGDINWVQSFNRGISDTLSNMASVPEAITDTAANAAGSLLPFAAAIQTTAKAMVLAGLSKQGITGVQAQAYLRTAAGQKALQEATKDAVPALSGVVGSGSAASQAQIAILSMTDETLENLPDYAQLRSEGLDNDAIRNRLASQAGNVGALPGAVIGYVAGFMNRGFDAAPLRTGGTTALSSTVRGVTNPIREAAQEFVEEGFANQFAANVGVASVDPNQRLMEGVSESGTMGAVGGGISGAASQAPGVALAGTKLTGKLAIDGLSATGRTLLSGIDTVTAARANKADTKSEAGINATKEAVKNITGIVDQLANIEIEESDTARREIIQEIADTVTLNDGQMSIADWVSASDNEKISEITPTQASMIISAFAAIQNITSDTLKEKIDGLDEADPIREIYQTALEEMQTVESATVLEKSKEIISELSSDEIKQLVPLEKLSDETTAEEEKKTIAQTAAVMARINPQAFTAEEWNVVFNQMSPEDAGKISQNDRAAVTTARDNAQIAVQTEAKKESNKERFQQVIRNLAPARAAKLEQERRERNKKTVAEVKIDIRGKIHKSEKTGKASLAQYTANTNRLMAEGKINAAKDLLTNLYKFAEAQTNKLEALNKSAETEGNKVEVGFQTWDGTQEKPSSFDAYIVKNNPASLLFALDVDADAREIIDTYNTLRNAYPELNTLPQIEAPLLSGQIDTLLDNFTEARDQRIDETPAKPAEKPAKQETTEQTAEPKTEDTKSDYVEPTAEDIADYDASQKPVKKERRLRKDAVLKKKESLIDDDDTVVEDSQTEDTSTQETTEQESPAPTKEIKRTPLKDALTNLFGGVANKIATVFKRKDKGSDLLDMENIAEELTKRFAENNKSEEANKAFAIIMERVLPGLEKYIADYISFDEKRAASWIANPSLYKSKPNLRLLEFFDQDTLKLNEKVSMAIAMAASEWIAELTYDAYQTENLHKLFSGRDARDEITEAMYRAGRFGGMNEQTALASLSKKIQDVLGLQENKAANPEDAQGIFGSLAATTFAALREKGLIESATFGGKDEGMTQKRFAVRPNIRNKQTIALRKFMRELNMPFSTALDIKANKFYIGKPPESIAQSTRWNKFSYLTRKLKKALEANQNIEHKLNAPLVSVVDVLGTETLASLLGHVEIKEGEMHPEDANSQRGKNQTIETSLESLETWRTLVKNYAEENDMEIEDVPVHFEAAVGSNGRINQIAPSNVPQSDKLLREVLVPSETVVDMSDETSMTSYWAGISQALGGKIEKSPSFDDVKADAQERLSERQETIGYLKKLLLDSALSESDGKKLTAQLKKYDFDMKILHALLAEAARQNAVDQNAKEFVTHLTIEADGVTDGPINAILNLLTPSEITPQLLEIMASGGLIFGEDMATLDDYYNRGSVDLYAMVAEKLGTRLNNDMKNDPGLAAIMNIADGFLDGLDRDKGSLIIDREVVKNPLTVFLYNSSPNGIADKLTELTAKNFYALMTQIAQSKEKVFTDSSVYKENQTALKNYMAFADPRYANKRIQNDDVNKFYKVPLEKQINKKKLRLEYLNYFVNPLLDSINDTLPGLKDNMDFLQEIAETQTALFQSVFEEKANALQEKLERPLSQDDLETVMKQALKVAPIFYTSTMSLEISKLGPAPTGNKIAQDFKEKVNFFETTKTPEDAGMKMVPNYVISTGDGQVIASVYANDASNIMGKSIQVYDGIEMSIDTFSDGSEHINKQVFNNWLNTNIYEEVQRSVDQVVSIKDLSAGAQELQAELKKLMARLDKKIDSSKKLKKIVQDFPSSTDHMAGAKRAYVNKGRTSLAGIAAFDFETMARIMDRQLQKASSKKPADGVAKQSKAFMDKVKQFGSAVKGHEKVLQIKGSALTSLLNSKEFTKDQKLVFAQIMKRDKIFNDYTFYFGDAADLEALRDGMYPDLAKSPISLGQTFTAEPVALIANMSPETLLHEMLHATLALRIISVKQEPEKFTVEIQKALQTLEGLKTRFLNMDITSIPDLEQDEREAFIAMKAQINAAGTEVEALSEFLSWSMSNKALIDKAKRTKIHKPLVQMILKILQTAKEFLGFVKRPGLDMFSNIVYNTAWLTRTYTPLSPAPNKVFEQRYGPNAHIEQVESIFTERLNHFIEGAADELSSDVVEMEKQYREAKITNLQLTAAKAIEKLNHNFFRLDQRQSNTFAAIYASLGTGFKIDSSAMQEATQLYNQVIDKLTAKDFVADWARSSQAEKDQAQAKLDALINEPPITMIALAQVDESFSTVLSKLKSEPDAVSTEGSQIDRVIRNIATSVGNNLSKLLTTTRDNSKPVNQQLAVLTVAMAEIQKERRFIAESFVTNAQMKADTWAADKIYDASGAASTKLENIADQYEQQSKIISGLARSASFVTGLANKDRSKQMLDKLQSELNKARSFDWVQAFVADLRSDRPDMIRLGKALNKVRDMADRVRQHQKDLRIKYMKAAFSKKLTEQDNKDLFMGLGRTDLSSIGRENVLALLRNPETVTQRLNDAKRELRQLSPQYFNAYMGKIKSLANYMMTWENDTPNLLRNAHAIGYLLNENNRPSGTIDNRILALISQITSLEAFDSLPSNTKTNLKNLMTNETEGMQIVVGNLAEVHSDEFGRRIQGREGEISLKNGWKGYLPMNFAQGQEVIIADDRDQAKLEEEGWVRIRSYSGDPRENNPASRGLYQTTVGGKGQFRQGILQTVHKQWHGVDPRNGVTNSSQATHGFLTGAAATRVSQSNAQARTGQDVDYMMPVFDSDGRVMGYEYSIPMRDLEGSAPEMDLIESLGSWFGRIEEEEVSSQLNKAAVLQQKAIYDKEYSESNADEWINVADPEIEDAVYKDAWSVLGWETKGNAAEAFGAANFFPIKRAEIDSMIGYRLANPKDLWTGVSRIDDNTRKIMRDIISLPFGKNTYTYMNKGYGIVSSAVSWGKVNIVIRSGIVPLGNFISNMVHLATWGVGFGAQLANMPKKLKEISRVVRIQEEIGKLSTELPSIINNPTKVKKIKSKIAALEAEQEAMSIWPVLQANEFSTISESLTRADVALRQGSIFDWLEKQADKLPPLVGDVTKTAILAKDTELFRMMHHFMQYGDFIAKSMLYDHLLETNQKTPQEALDIISVEYVNYNRPAGRWRDALEASGMLWFSNYALRIMPIMVNLLRDRPVSALIYGGGVAPLMDIDTVISGSAPGKLWRDALGYSFGPGMGFRSIQLNPVINSVF